MAPVLTKRTVKGSRLTAAEHDDNMTNIEAAFGAVESNVAGIQQTISQGGAQRVVDFRDYVGIDLDGNNDSTSTVNTALMEAYTAGLNAFMPAGSIRVSQIKLPTRTELVGAGMSHSRIISTGANGAVVISKNIISVDAHPIEGRCRIAHLRIEGTGNQSLSNQHGILFRDFFSSIDHVEIRNTGGSAIRVQNASDSGAATSSTLVNNRYSHISCYEIYGAVGMFLGGQGNVSLTDGHMRDVYIGTSRTGSDGGTTIYVGNCAGWSISNIHTYTYHPTLGDAVPAPGAAMHLYQPWHAQITDIYAEQWLNSCIYIQAGTGVTNIDNVTVRADKCTVGGSVVYVDRLAGTSPIVRVDGITMTKEGASTNQCYGVTAGDGARVNVDSPVSIAGARAGDLLANRKIGTGTLYVPNATGGWASV
jgi:hypothetical protein